MSNKKVTAKKVIKIILSIVSLLLIISIVSVINIAACQILDLYDYAKETKHNAEDFVALMKDKDFYSAKDKLDEVHSSIKYFRSLAENEYVDKAASYLKKYEGDYRSACRLLDIADETLDEWSDRTFDLLFENPLDGISSDAGFNIPSIMAYLDYAQEAVPMAEDLLSELSEIELSFYDLKGKIGEHRDKIDELLGVYHQAEYYFPLIRAFLGDGTVNKYYLVFAQNTAEIRPGGGFPGSVGSVRIKDGYLSIGDFRSVWDIFPDYTPYHLAVDWWTNEVFGGVVNWPRDAEMNPDFEFLGKYWCDVYEYQNGIRADAVVSVTPAIIQEFLRIFGEIELSNGDVMNGDNAVRLLQHDWYVRYMNSYQIMYGIEEPNKVVDALFSEVTKALLPLCKDVKDIGVVPKLIDMVEKCADNRVLMIWMNDPEAQKLVKEYGFSGGLGDDPEKPVVGVYFGNNYASKMGWWIDADSWIGEGRLLSDGSIEYDAHVTFTNIFDPSEAYYLGYWIAGVRMNGILDWYVYVFGPAGGDIYDVCIDYWWNPCNITWYKGHTLGYMNRHYFHPGTETVYFTIRTAPGVTEKPVIKMTPTVTEYR